MEKELKRLPLKRTTGETREEYLTKPSWACTVTSPKIARGWASEKSRTWENAMEQTLLNSANCYIRL